MDLALWGAAFIAVLNGATANYCTQNLQGKCNPLTYGCQFGDQITLNYCGLSYVCCYPSHISHVTQPHYPVYTQPPVYNTQPAVGSHGSLGGGQCGISDNPGHRMLGGYPAHLGQFPWQVSLQYAAGKAHLCGGTLVHPQWVITAGHCFKQFGTGAHNYVVALGVQNQKTAPASNFVHVEHVYRHPQFVQEPSLINDITMVKLSKPVDTSGQYIRTACLPDASDTFSSDMCQISGWGAHHYDPTGHAQVSATLEYENLRTMMNSECSYYEGFGKVQPTQICAGATLSTGGTGPCQGDSGGPLVCPRNGAWHLTGVVSYGAGCAERGHPGIYTRVTSYLPWINQHINYY